MTAEAVNESVKQAKRVVQAAEDLDRKKDRIVSELTELKKVVEKHSSDVKISKTVGNSTAIVGGLGLLAAPFTGGLSLVIAGTAGAAAVAGAATSIGAEIGDAIRQSGFHDKLKAEVQEFKALIDNMDKQINKLEEELDSPRLHENLEKGAVIAREVTSAGSTVAGMLSTIAAIKNVQRGFGITKNVKVGGDVFLASSNKALQVASGAKVSKLTKVGKVGGRVLVGVGIVLDTVDLVLTWTGKDATVAAIENAIEKIKEAMSHLNDYKKALKASLGG